MANPEEEQQPKRLLSRRAFLKLAALTGAGAVAAACVPNTGEQPGASVQSPDDGGSQTGGGRLPTATAAEQQQPQAAATETPGTEKTPTVRAEGKGGMIENTPEYQLAIQQWQAWVDYWAEGSEKYMAQGLQVEKDTNLVIKPIHDKEDPENVRKTEFLLEILDANGQSRTMAMPFGVDGKFVKTPPGEYNPDGTILAGNFPVPISGGEKGYQLWMHDGRLARYNGDTRMETVNEFGYWRGDTTDVKINERGVMENVPQTMKDNASRWLELKDRSGSKYGEEIFANVNGEEVLIAVKQEGGEWVSAPYGLGLPKKDGFFYKWGNLENDPERKGWNKAQIILYKDAEAMQKVEQVVESLDGMVEKQPRHPGRARMMFSDMLNMGLRVKETDEESMYNMTMTSIYDSREMERTDYWDTIGGKPASIDQLIKMAQPDENGNQRLLKFDFVTQIRDSGRTTQELEADYSELDVIVATENDLNKNPYAAALFNRLSLSDNKYFGFPSTNHDRIQRIEFTTIGKSKRLVWLAIDYNTEVYMNRPEVAPLQMIGDINGLPFENTELNLTKLFRMSLEHNVRVVPGLEGSSYILPIVYDDPIVRSKPIIDFSRITNSLFDRI